MFSVNLEQYSFFKNVTLKNEIPYIYTEPNAAANFMASVRVLI